MTRRERFETVAGLAIAGLLAGCGPSAPPTPDTTAEARAEIEHEQVEVGPMPLQSALQEADLRIRAEPATPGEEASREDAGRAAQSVSPNRVSGANAVSGSASGVWRADGRPTWWVDRPGWRDGRYLLSAEAMGDDVLSARRAALAAARADAERALGRGMRDERVESAIVRRLSTDSPGAPGRERYVGYVRLSALRAGD
ncbi:MAG: hypothetical protein KF684_10055 [Phycisphaeraceae bacterium]|nr:hypothetical protein [Phycisphaeraceae bacterium]